MSLRSEMLELLYAISSAANRTSNLDDFLLEVISQIVPSFQSDVSAIYLLVENINDLQFGRMVLAAHYGISENLLNTMLYLSMTNELIRSILVLQKPILINDINTDPTIPDSIRMIGGKSLLAAPLSIEGKILGLIILARKKDIIYNDDEIARLNIVAEEIAKLIQSKHQSQLTISLLERQRLVRDLHDSVLQNLYGLVALAEAAKAADKHGETDFNEKVFSRISDTARQALKEIRLFLHELQPVDIERKGLVTILHDRLAVVEGRVDIKARLIADANITLPISKEVGLYFIAQEALNNVLRHANAKSVTVRLKQNRSNVVLEIEDDGCGFNPGDEDNHGMGLRNMQERATQIGGRLNISSRQGKGTKVLVTVTKDRQNSVI